MSDFEYNHQYLPQALLSIEQIGECAIEATNDEGFFYYLIVKTLLGMTTIFECGPVIPDITKLPDGFTTRLTRMNFDNKKLTLVISKWLNERSKKITDANCVTIEEALTQFRDLKTYIENFSEETY